MVDLGMRLKNTPHEELKGLTWNHSLAQPFCKWSDGRIQENGLYQSRGLSHTLAEQPGGCLSPLEIRQREELRETRAEHQEDNKALSEKLDRLLESRLPTPR